MADIYLLTKLTLPSGVAHESLPGTTRAFIAECWQGMSRAQMIARAKARGLRPSFRATARCAQGDTGLFELCFSDGAGSCLMLAHLQRVRNIRGRGSRAGRAAASRPPERDPRQTSLF
ncbi:hypothetical protein [Paraburkholderia strydomiana]|uniref:hypothetical protein n=1 Tax=Paraburkholderia strydomiana TaxID=1245417 RepID=UPI001BE83E3F|nr:hypothetical protein [Paraburkholderia strydomiana]MBT2792866.1 hypothetical protein [Paraburkholderia strydomiana]